MAGLTAGVVALPLSLAFGVASGLGAIAGLYGAIAVGFFASIFGGTPTQISGPTGPMTVIAATIIAQFSREPGIIVGVFFLAGLIQILFGTLRLGRYVKYIPYPVVSGFMSGIGLIIILLQIHPLLGLPPSTEVVDALFKLIDLIPQTNLSSLLLACLTIAVVYLFPKITQRVPSTLVALVVGTLVSVFFSLNVPTIGDIPVGLPQITLPTLSLDQWDIVLIPAITLAALGSIDSLLTSVVADRLVKGSEKHQGNKELVGQGIGNMCAALIGGIPGAGATMRTVVNIQAGGRTRLSGAVHALFLLAIVLGLSPLASRIPISVLAGILITVGISIIDYRSFKDIRKVPRIDTIVKLVVMGVTVFVDLLQAVGIGVVLASLLFIKRIGDIGTEFTKGSLKLIPWNCSSMVLIRRFTGPLFFGLSHSLQMLEHESKEGQGIKALVLDMREVAYIDQSGLYALEELLLEQESIIPCYVVVDKEQPRAILSKMNLQAKRGIHFATTVDEAFAGLEDMLGEREIKDESAKGHTST